MIGFLRFIGVVNAAIWFGSAIFVTAVAGPTFFSDEMTAIFRPPYNGVAAQMLLKRYFYLHYCCAGTALIHLMMEKLYTGRSCERWLVGLVTGILGLSLLGGLWISPKLRQLHILKYRGQTAEIRADAGKSFGAWHGVSQVSNMIVTAGLLVYLWKITSLNDPTRVPGFRRLTVGWK